jgi:hypothetical protein
MTKIFDWIKANMLLAIGIAIVLVVFVFGKPLKRLLFGTHRVKHRKSYYISHPVKRRSITRTARKPIPRSVGTHKGNGYPAAGGGTIPFKYNKDGSIKKAWQVSGTVAAKARMSRLRKSR